MLLILSRVFLGASLLAPLVVRRDMFFPFISGKVFFFRIMIEGALAFFLLHLCTVENKRELFQQIKNRLKQPLVMSVLIFAGIFTLTALTAENQIQAFWSNFERGEGAFQILHYALFFLLTTLLFDTRIRLERLGRLQIWISVLVSLYALGQRLAARLPWAEKSFSFLVAVTERSSGTLGNPSYLAAYILLTLPLLIYFLLRAKRMSQYVLYISIMFFELGILLNTSTRGAFLGLIVGVISFLILRVIHSKSNRLKMICASIVVCSVVLAGIFFTTYNAPLWRSVPLISRSLDLNGALDDFKPRVWTWQSAVAGIIERPLLGWGAENFSFPFDKNYNPNHYGIESFFDRTHNIFLEYAISGGILLLLSFLFIFYFFYRIALKMEHGVWRDIVLVIPVMYFIQGFFLFDVLPIYITLFLFIAFVLNTSLPPSEDALLGESRITGFGIVGSLSIIFVIIALMYVGSFRPLEKNLTLASAFKQSNFKDSFIRYQSAIELPSFVGQEETVSSAFKFSLNALEASLRSTPPPPLEAARSIVDINNYWYETYRHTFIGIRDLYLIGGLNIRAGVGFGQNDYLAKGEEIYAEALAYSPTRIEFIEILMQVAKVKGDELKLNELLRRAKILRPDIDWEGRVGITSSPN